MKKSNNSENLSHVFIVGTGRNGSTLISDILASHPAFTWVSNYQDKLPQVLLISKLNNLIMHSEGNALGSTVNTKNKVNYLKRLWPRHSEAYTFWNHYTQMNFSRSFMADMEASDSQAISIRRAISTIAKYNKKTYFLSKLTGPPRVTFINSIFPEAKFIYIRRDPFYVLNSYLNVDYWINGGGLEKEWWTGILTDKQKDILDKEPSTKALAAYQISNILEQSERELQAIPKERKLDVRYEEFLENPTEEILKILKFAGLELSDFIDRYIEEKKIYPSQKSVPFRDDKQIIEIFENHI